MMTVRVIRNDREARFMPTQNVNLADHHANFIRSSVDSGRYRNASEVVRAGLRLLEDHEAETNFARSTQTRNPGGL